MNNLTTSSKKIFFLPFSFSDYKVPDYKVPRKCKECERSMASAYSLVIPIDGLWFLKIQTRSIISLSNLNISFTFSNKISTS